MKDETNISTPRCSPESREIAHVFLAMRAVRDRVEFAELLTAFFARLRASGYDLRDIAAVIGTNVVAMEDELLALFQRHFRKVTPALSRPDLAGDEEDKLR